MPAPQIRSKVSSRKPTSKKAFAKPSSVKKISTGVVRKTTEGAINIRVRPDERALIDQAAALAGKSRSEFMLEAARDAATTTILDRTLFRMDAGAFGRFTAMLDAPPQPNAKLRKLMKTKAPWA
jgi:uncharacterized protein (DUF1778 family)